MECSSSDRPTSCLYSAMVSSWLLSFICYELWAIVEFSEELLHCCVCARDRLATRSGLSFQFLIRCEEVVSWSCVFNIISVGINRLYQFMFNDSLRVIISVNVYVRISVSHYSLNMIYNLLVSDTSVGWACLEWIYESTVNCCSIWVLFASSIKSLALPSGNGSLLDSNI